MCTDEKRDPNIIIAEIKSYNGRMKTPERISDLEILSNELGGKYDVRVWTFNKHLRVAVIHKQLNRMM